MMTTDRIRATIRTFAFATVSVAALALTPLAVTAQHEHHEHSTSDTPLTCDAAATPAGTSDHGDHESPVADQAEVEVETEFDVLYIDMMLPHHNSIIALSQAALPELTDPRLKEMAREVIRAQTSENEQLIQWRTEWYGSSQPVMDDASMTMMLEAMPVGTMDEMMREMDTAWQITTFCAAENPDLAFIQQSIPHHQMAIDASVIAIEEAVHPELVAYAQEVIAAQQAEVDLLNEILAELEGESTPAS